MVAGQWQLAAAQPSVMRALEPTAGSDANVAPHAAGQPILTLLVNENPCGCLFSWLRYCPGLISPGVIAAVLNLPAER